MSSGKKSQEEDSKEEEEEEQQQPYSILKTQEIFQEVENPEMTVTSYGKKVVYHPVTNMPGVYHVESVNETVKKKKSIIKKTGKGGKAGGDPFSKDSKESMKKLKDFNIPSQKTLLNILLEDDHYMHNFNGFIREYYSHVLRSYCLMNMQGRYRGLQPTATCLTMIDISRLTSKEATLEKQQNEYAQGREAMLDKLRAVALDELHFKYLKELANNQPLILPISIMHEIIAETTPAVNNVWNFYRSHLGKNHECSKQAGQHYTRLEKRLEMYQQLGFGDNIITSV